MTPKSQKNKLFFHLFTKNNIDSLKLFYFPKQKKKKKNSFQNNHRRKIAKANGDVF